MLFECHITVSTKDAEAATKVAKEFKWKTSEITRDPVLGEDNFFCLTTHADDYLKIFSKMEETSGTLICMYNVEVLREKIELIMYDTKKVKV